MIVRGQLNRRSLWTGHEAKEEEPVPLSCTYHPAMQNAPYQYINTSDHVPIINADHFAINPSQSLDISKGGYTCEYTMIQRTIAIKDLRNDHPGMQYSN